jgi:hypothetical protein
MAKTKAKTKKEPKPPTPLILQPRTVTTEDNEKREVTTGELIVLAVRSGLFRAEAARAARVSRTTIHNWEERGEDAIAAAQEHVEEGQQVTPADVPESERPYVEFALDLDQAEAEVEGWHVRNIKRHAEKDWKASSWWLARKHPERWGVREHPDNSGGVTVFDIERMVDEAAAEA